MTESKEELNNLWVKVKQQSEKSGLKLNIQKMKIMASGPITLRQIKGEKVEAVTDLFSWGPKSLWIVMIAMEFRNTCSLEEKL